MLSIFKKLEDKSFFRRLNSISDAEDAVANDVLYHYICWNSAKRQAEPKSYPIYNAIKATSDIEILSFIESFFNHDPKNKVLDMNNVNSIYRKILLENGEELQKASLDKKKHLKTLITENVSDIVFIKSKNHNKPEPIMTSSTQSEVISDICDSITTNNDIKSMLKLAKKIHEDILSQDWKFTGDFSTYKTPALLSIFLKWVLFGPCVLAENDDTKKIESLLNVTAQFISQNVKTNRQTNYYLQQNSKTIASKIETPLNIGSG